MPKSTCAPCLLFVLKSVVRNEHAFQRTGFFDSHSVRKSSHIYYLISYKLVANIIDNRTDLLVVVPILVVVVVVLVIITIACSFKIVYDP